jgi:hypothetical protein
MPRPRLFLTIGACAALASACAPEAVPPAVTGAPSPPVLAPPVPPPPPAATRHDGRYLGWARRVNAWSPNCTERTQRSSMVVESGRARLIIGSGGNAPLEGTVAHNDELSLASETSRAIGRFPRPGRAVLRVQDAHCAYRVALRSGR